MQNPDEVQSISDSDVTEYVEWKPRVGSADAALRSTIVMPMRRGLSAVCVTMHCRSVLRLAVDCGVWPGQADLSAGHVLWLLLFRVLLKHHLLQLWSNLSAIIQNYVLLIYTIATRIAILQRLRSFTGERLFAVQEDDSCYSSHIGKKTVRWLMSCQKSEPLNGTASHNFEARLQGIVCLGQSIASFNSSLFASDDLLGRHFFLTIQYSLERMDRMVLLIRVCYEFQFSWLTFRIQDQYHGTNSTTSFGSGSASVTRPKKHRPRKEAWSILYRMSTLEKH